jgi:large subunit ribosomal protein L25
MQGITPAIVYGSGIDAVNIQMETKKLMAQLLEYYRKNVLVNLKIDGMGDKNVTIAEVQTDPVHDTLIHVDFCEIDLAKERSFNVPVTYTGVAKGVDLGGFLAISHNSVVLEAKPLDIPDECVVDITDLDIGDNIKCSEIIIPDNVKLMTDPQSVAVVVVKPGAQEVEEEVEEGAEGVEGEETEAAETEAEE